MLKAIRKLFERKRRPIIGEKWLFSPRCLSAYDPWPQQEYTAVVILDVKKGWVRYRMGCLYSDGRKSVREFVAMYKPLTETTKKW